MPLFVDKTIHIHASITAVWKVLTDVECTKEWAGEFQNNTQALHLESGWKLREAVQWKKDDGETIVTGEVTALKANAMLRFTVRDVRQKEMHLTEEDGITYFFNEKDGVTTLQVRQGDFSVLPNGETYRNFTDNIWERVLPKVKFLAEMVQKISDHGYKTIMLVPLPPAHGTGAHTHDEITAHAIVRGELTILDSPPQVFKVGDFVEFPAGTTHEAKGNVEGGTMMIGF